MRVSGPGRYHTSPGRRDARPGASLAAQRRRAAPFSPHGAIVARKRARPTCWPETSQRRQRPFRYASIDFVMLVTSLELVFGWYKKSTELRDVFFLENVLVVNIRDKINE
jgi:hypothetical protein